MRRWPRRRRRCGRAGQAERYLAPARTGSLVHQVSHTGRAEVVELDLDAAGTPATPSGCALSPGVDVGGGRVLGRATSPSTRTWPDSIFSVNQKFSTERCHTSR
jgi:hypothetical protein